MLKRAQRFFPFHLSLTTKRILTSPRSSNSSSSSGTSHPRTIMTTFTLPNTQVPVKLVEGLREEELLAFPAFKNWISTLQANLARQQTDPQHEFHEDPYQLREIRVQAIDRFAGSRLGFIKLTATITDSSGSSLPGAVFLRGASVAMMVILKPSDVDATSQAEKYVLLTVQPRIAAGSLEFVELPAGMVDDGTFKGAAAREIEEELGLKIEQEELVDLTALALEGLEGARTGEQLHSAVYPSAGGCDEYIPIFLCEKTVKRETLKEWTGKLTGLREKGEKITLKLIKLEDLWREGGRDSKALAAWALWEGLHRNGKV